MSGAADPLYVRARTALLDAWDARDPRPVAVLYCGHVNPRQETRAA